MLWILDLYVYTYIFKIHALVIVIVFIPTRPSFEIKYACILCFATYTEVS